MPQINIFHANIAVSNPMVVMSITISESQKEGILLRAPISLATPLFTLFSVWHVMAPLPGD